MEKRSGSIVSELYGNLGSLMRRCLFRVLSVGPIPSHFGFIMDGNRRYAKKENLEAGAGHKAGFSALISILKYCYELGVTYVTIYAFSIDNFKRQPEEVQKLMDLMLEKIEELLKEESIVNQYGIRVHFIGNLKLLSEPVRVAAKKVMRATASNVKCMLIICIAYTSRDEIVHAVQESCKAKSGEIIAFNSHKACNGRIEEDDPRKKNGVITHNIQEYCKDESDEFSANKASTTWNGVTKGADGTENESSVVQGFHGDEWGKAQVGTTVNSAIPVEKSEGCSIVKLVDIEKHMYMAVAPDPDIVIRSSGEARLSNFLLWQTSNCLLYSPDALWPEMGLRHLVWAVINYQRHQSYFQKKKKQP